MLVVLVYGLNDQYMYLVQSLELMAEKPMILSFIFNSIMCLVLVKFTDEYLVKKFDRTLIEKTILLGIIFNFINE